jgi:protein-S-isoprenylcysteine O-methyltransferase Ste14
MHNLTLWQLVMWPWYAVGIFWAIGALKVKDTKTSQPFAGRISYMIVIGCSFALLFSDRTRIGHLGERFLAQDVWITRAGVILSFAGAAIAIWARAILGQNWSARVSLKVDHQLIRSGLYAYVRHPIYSGFLLMVIGTATVQGEFRGLLAIPVAAIGLTLKAKQEEALLRNEFGEPYMQYCRESGFLLPRF